MNDAVLILSDVLSVADLGALAVLVLACLGIGWLSEHRWGPVSVTVLMEEVRRDWMREYVRRDNRIADAQIIGSLRQGTSFFASTSFLAIGGVLALIGNAAPLAGLVEQIERERQPLLLLQVRLVPAALFLTHAFLKFVWANRVFAYCSVMMAAVPSDPSDPNAMPRAMRAAALNIRAALNFNRGLRSLYFALASLAWLAGPLWLVVATVLITVGLWRREFASVPRDILSDGA